MNERHLLLIAISLVGVGGCTDHDGESVSPPESASQANATKDDAPASAVADAPVDERSDPESEPPRTAPPTQLFVAAEGRCRYMTTSIVQGKALVRYGEQPIVELAPDGTRGELIIDTTLPREKGSAFVSGFPMPQVERFGGRLPNQLFAEAIEYPREGTRAVYRNTPNGWEKVSAFGESGVDRMYPWYDGSLLAFAAYNGNAGAKFAVVRGKPKGPRFDRAMAKAGCNSVDADQVLVLESGDVVATWGCEQHNTFVTHWAAGDLAGNTHDLGVDGGWGYNDRREPWTIASDRKGGFFVVGHALKGKDKLWHGKNADWAQIEMPSDDVRRIATEPDGRLWIAGNHLSRRDGDAWKTIDVPEGKRIDELAGVEYGTPWIREGARDEYQGGGRLWRIADDKATEVIVPPSAFFEDEALRVSRMHFVGPDDLWADSEFVVQRHGKGGPGRYYHAVLRSQPTKHPLRCGQLIDGSEMKQPLVPWPTAAGGTCEKRLALLMRRRSWDDTNDYTKFRKALKSVAGIEGVRFAELEIGQEKFFTAITPDAALVATMQKKIKKLRPYTFPEVVCGDDAVLEKAGVVVHRELSFAPAG